jgi:hypothetical protein
MNYYSTLLLQYQIGVACGCRYSKLQMEEYMLVPPERTILSVQENPNKNSARLNQHSICSRPSFVEDRLFVSYVKKDKEISH